MRIVAYYRVSKESQRRSGLGLEAQKQAVANLCAAKGWKIAAEFTETESGKRNDRRELCAALRQANVTGATLAVAKLDRLSRDAEFTLHLRNSGVDFVCADNPTVTRLTIGLLAVVNEDERERISLRTREALAAAKARGVVLGNPNGAAALLRAGKGNKAAIGAVQGLADRHATLLAPEVLELKQEGMKSFRELAAGMNARSLKTPRGGKWHPASVRNLVARLAALGLEGPAVA